MGYHGSKERNRRLKKTYDETKHYYGSGVYYDDKKKRYIRYYPSSKTGYTKYLRRISNKRVRRMDYDDVLKYGQYRKMFDYWWTLI